MLKYNTKDTISNDFKQLFRIGIIPCMMTQLVSIDQLQYTSCMSCSTVQIRLGLGIGAYTKFRLVYYILVMRLFLAMIISLQGYTIGVL